LVEEAAKIKENAARAALNGIQDKAHSISPTIRDAQLDVSFFQDEYPFHDDSESNAFFDLVRF
jgi:hypothetical protein